MTYGPGSDHYFLASGRVVYANGGILGIDGDLNVHEGYDGGFGPSRYAIEQGQAEPFTVAEKQEVAAFVCALWQQWAATADHPTPPPEEPIP